MTRAKPTPPPASARSRERLAFIQPMRISSAGAALAALYQPASGRDTAVLICNPFGQEAIRAHRPLRVLSERLGRSGIPSLRFDYFGTGDSPGEDGAGRMSRWRYDIIQADALLRERSGCPHTIWLGLRLGATLALQAANELNGAPPPRRIILWEPVLDGTAYLQHLQRMHQYWTRCANVTDEVLGFQLPQHLRQRIQAIRADSLPLPQGVPLDLLSSNRLDGSTEFMARAEQQTRIEMHPQASRIEWTSNTALASQWVPDETIASVLSICTVSAS